MEFFEFIKTAFAISFIFSWLIFMVSILYFVKSIADQDEYSHIVLSIIMIFLSFILYFNAFRALNHIKTNNYKQTIQYIEKK